MKKIFLLLSVFVCSQLCADWLIEKTHLDPGDDVNCPNGGALLTFSDTETTEEPIKAYVCNGENGCNMLAEQLPPSAGCQSIKSGADCDKDDMIDQGTETTITLCSGKSKDNGSISIDAGNAADGPNGSDGENGKVSELVITEEAAGENCKAGGTRIENRFDSDGNGTFEDSEVSVKYVCNGEDGITPESPKGDPGLPGTDGEKGSRGDKGETGDKGEQGEAGIPGEKGADGSDGHDTLMSVAEEAAGANCKHGGKKFMSGIDSDDNGVLDETEIKSSYYICNGNNAAEPSDDVKESGCAVTSVDTDGLSQISSAISAVYNFISDLF